MTAKTDPELFAALQLIYLGYTVMPMLTPAQVADYRQRINDAEAAFPEFQPGTTEPKVLGSFGAYANPSSFHAPVFRELHKLSWELLKPLMAAVATELGFLLPEHGGEPHAYYMVDRFSRRVSALTGESDHRDMSPNLDQWPHPSCLEGGQGVKFTHDTVFGGWVNLDDTAQAFSCLPSTHLSATGFGGNGFRPLSKADKAWVQVQQKQKTKVSIPSGHRLVFAQLLIHEVLPGPKPVTPSMRLYGAVRLQSGTHVPQAYADELRLVIADQYSFKTPSGEFSPYSTKNHRSSLMYTHNAPWSLVCPIPELTYQHVVATGENKGDVVRLVHHHSGVPDGRGQFTPHSLQSLSAALGRDVTFPPWTPEEKAMLLPTPL